MDIPYFLGLSLVYDAWLRSSGDYYASTAFNIAASGGDSGDLTNTRYAVRPALLNCNKFEKAVDIPHFWVYRSHI